MTRIKPHHLIDIICGFGAGLVSPTPSPYGHALHLVTPQVLANPDELVLMELGADDICAPCRHNREGVCDDVIEAAHLPPALRSKQAYNLLMDQRWSARLQLRQDEMLSVRDFCLRVAGASDDLRDIYAEQPAAYAVDKSDRLARGCERLLAVPKRHRQR